ncbi:MAG: T9SS type A sorting domain-containing protein, partial [Bacteroidota bacterium]
RTDSDLINSPESVYNISSASTQLFPLNMYPNPTTGTIHFGGNQGMLELMLYTLSGELIRSESVRNKETPIMNLSSLRPGVYILEVKRENEIYIERLIKK